MSTVKRPRGRPPKNTNGSSSQVRLLSPPMKSSSSSSSSSSSYSSASEKRVQKQQRQQQQMEASALEDKQQKANRIISEAIAKARERGEKNIPRVMSPESFPSSSQHRGHRSSASKSKSKDKSSKKARIITSSKSKQKTKIGKIVIKFGKKKKRKAESSDDLSDDERPRRRSSRDDDSKRRSNRQVKRKKYAEQDSRVSDDEMKVIVKAKKINSEPAENPSEEDAAVVDKIMASRIVKNEVSPGVMVEVEEFYVKYKNYSYLHCEWATEQHLEKDKRIQQKIKRFKIKQAQRAHFFADMDEDPFNPDYVEVDRVLEVSYCEDKDTGEPVVYYLVKWCSLPYEDSTWELKEDVDQTKIEEFEKLQAARVDSRRVERPPASHWKKLEQSREYRNGNSLRDYQLEGVNWLLFNWYNRRNCILADEMGLGKTIQSITFLKEIHRKGIKGPFLIIAPLSTIANWEREFRTWTHLNVIVYHGSVLSRQMLQQYEMYFRDAQGRVVKGAYRFQAVITTFEMILGGCPELNAIEWRCVIIDEAHRLKNKNCKLLEGFKLMNLEHKVLLTGTPLQNTVEELFSLLHFLEPSRFPSENTFMQEFGDLKTEEQVQKLQAILKPMMLRRLKEDVEKKLAPKEETIIEVELTNIQKKYYRAILEKNFSFLAKGVGQANVPNLVNTMMELRKCCNHPYLIKGAEEKILEDFREVCSPSAPDFHLQAMVQSAGKLVLIDKLLPKMKAGGHKVLIFSQMVRCLDILEDYLIQRRYLYERIDGRVRGNLRQAAIDRFSKPDSDPCSSVLSSSAPTALQTTRERDSSVHNSEMKTAAVAVLGLLGALCLCSRTEATTAWDVLRNSAANFTGILPCGGWNCDCEFRNPKGCCCVASQLSQLEEATFMRMVGLWTNLTGLTGQIDEIIDGRNIAFTATLTPTPGCFGPFTRNVSIPYQNITLNQGYGYNGALGAFTAPRPGVYSFSYTVYSNMGPARERIYYKTQLVKDGQVIASSWEDNREDSEDSSTQSVLLPLRQGNQVYVELVSGRYLCADTQNYNTFSGYLVYPLLEM